MIFNRFRKKNKSGKAKKARRGHAGPSIITSEVVIDGNLISAGELQIDGEINGHVRAKAVVVDINGLVHGEVAAEDIIVRGRVIGPIRGIHVHILNGAHVQGDVLNETISIENGAFLDGKIHRVDDPLASTFSSSHPDDTQGVGRQDYHAAGYDYNSHQYDETGYQPAPPAPARKPENDQT